MFGLTLVLKVFVTCCHVSIFIEYNSLLYSIVINEKLVYKLLKTTSGEKVLLFSRKVHFGVPRPGTCISCDRFPYDCVLNDMLPTDKRNSYKSY